MNQKKKGVRKNNFILITVHLFGGVRIRFSILQLFSFFFPLIFRKKREKQTVTVFFKVVNRSDLGI